MKKDWIVDHLAYLRGMKSPTATQRLLLQLSEVPERNRQEEREFAALIKLEQINQRAAQAKVKAHKIIRDKSESDRKERNHRLILQGALIDLAGLDQVDRGILLGGLLELADRLRKPDSASTESRLKAQGDALLAQRDHQPNVASHRA